MESLVQAIFENGMHRPDKIALIVEDTQLTYGELTHKIAVFANSLKAKKIKRGSRVVIETHDLASFYCAFLGCHLAGCIAVPAERDISIYKLHELLKAVKPVLIFIKNQGEKYEDYFEGSVPTKIAFPKEEQEATVVSTTGTTGNPALVVHTNKSMLAETQNLCTGTNITQDTVLFTNILGHMAAGYRRVFAALYAGATAVITDQSVSLHMLGKYAEKYKIDHLSLISTDVRLLAEEASLDKTEKLDSVKYVESATSTLYYDTILKFHAMFPHVVLFNVYGTTESGCLLINNTLDNFTDGCIGRPACNAQVSVVDENGERIETPGKYGYVSVKGSMNMKGYYKKKALTDKVLQQDTIVLNDIVYFDEAGDFYFVSRVGDVINVKGQKIIPAEIERQAMQFGGIRDCACVAKDDEQQGQVPVLYIVCEDEQAFDFNRFRNYLHENLEAYRVPRDIIPIEKMPCTPTGKIMRKHLSLMTK